MDLLNLDVQQLFQLDYSSSQLIFYIFFLMFLNSFAMVPPSEYICIGVGVLVYHSKIGFIEGAVVATIANFIGTSFWYWLGIFHRKRSKHLRHSEKFPNNKILNRIYNLYTKNLHSIEIYFIEHGNILLFFLRNVPVVRSIASYPAGRANMPAINFIGISFAGILTWVSIWITFGFFLGNIAYNYKWHLSLFVGLLSLLIVKISLSRLNKKVLNKVQEKSQKQKTEQSHSR